VLSVFTDDIGRCEFSKRYASMPWFDVQDGALVLRNVPVQDASDPNEVRQRAFKDAIGHSALVDAVCATICREWWFENQKRVRVHPPGKGREIARLLVQRIAAFCQQRGVELLLVLQGERSTADADDVFAYARGAGVRTLDLIALVQEAERADPTTRARLFSGHMTDAGNRWAAEHIAVALRGR
jgi:GNAT superfamily N-acetyltransferase